MAKTFERLFNVLGLFISTYKNGCNMESLVQIALPKIPRAPLIDKYNNIISVMIYVPYKTGANEDM